MPATRAAAEPARPLALAARAKINLYLHVLGRRDDGYHLIDSLIAFAEAGDRLSVAPAPRLELATEGPEAAALRATLAAPGDNLVLRAAHALAALAGPGRGARLRLDKRLPNASGLGGGSSDAAAALIGLCRLWDLAPAAAALERIALALGADVPACLRQPTPVFVGGIGERLTPAPALPPAGLLLVNPRLALPTARVFAGLGATRSAPARFERPPASAAELALLLAERRNDLEGSALGLAPAIGEVLQALAALPGALLARMSGSGATCFGLFADLETARRAGRTLRTAHPAWWLAATSLAGPAP